MRQQLPGKDPPGGLCAVICITAYTNVHHLYGLAMFQRTLLQRSPGPHASIANQCCVACALIVHGQSVGLVPILTSNHQ